MPRSVAPGARPAKAARVVASERNGESGRVTDLTTTAPKPGLAQPGAPHRQSTQKILEAAEQVFAEHGYGGATMAAIARAAGLPKPNLHYYFGSKDALYAALLENILSLWLDDADLWLIAERDPATALSGYIRAKLAWARERPEASRIFAGELLTGARHIDAYLRGDLRARVARIDTVFATWRAQGRMRPVDTRHLLFCLWSMTQSYADFSAQMVRVLETDALEDADFAAAEATISALVLRGVVIDGG
ncbi:TetR family transcriptional regulator C-terminal domain-containing protein [Endobacter medicaginis]|uniref:TetR family transcriptional regulator C-terminal domain-containing protein n=1 Tax=Endobacter medicaginis TaxID=1181271 RepID=A0A850NK19_9PROT|nr:TetR family transcriptional regulator C-terminal domain-containing protein [Endobacter medicaginis]